MYREGEIPKEIEEKELKKKLFDCLLDMDIQLCNDLDDAGGDTATVKHFRDLTKVLVHLLKLENEFAEFLEMDVEEIREVCRKSYENWKALDKKG